MTIMFMEDDTGLNEEDSADLEIKKRMKLIEGKLKEIREIRAEIREINKSRTKKRFITIHVPRDKKEEIQKRIKEMMEEYKE